jgi:hypothetical protein
MHKPYQLKCRFTSASLQEGKREDSAVEPQLALLAAKKKQFHPFAAVIMMGACPLAKRASIDSAVQY